MATNKILPFADTAASGDTLTDAQYASDARRRSGHVRGIASKELANKSTKQAAAVAAGVGQFVADNQPEDVTDADTPSGFAEKMAAALVSFFAPRFATKFDKTGGAISGGATIGVAPPAHDSSPAVPTTAWVQQEFDYHIRTSPATGHPDLIRIGPVLIVQLMVSLGDPPQGQEVTATFDWSSAAERFANSNYLVQATFQSDNNGSTQLCSPVVRARTPTGFTVTVSEVYGVSNTQNVNLAIFAIGLAA